MNRLNLSTKSFQSIFQFDKLLIILLLSIVFVITLKEGSIGFIINRSLGSILGVTSSAIFIFLVMRIRQIIFPYKITIIFILLLLWMIISFLFSSNIGNSMWEVLRIISYFMIFFTTYNMFKNNPQGTRFFILLFTIIATSIFIFDFFNFFKSGDYASGIQFIGSFFWHNQMAGFLIFLIPLHIDLLLNQKSYKKKLFFLTLVVTSIFAMILTTSRGGWLSLSFALVFYSLFRFKLLFKNALFIGGIIVIVSLLAIFFTKPIVSEKAITIPTEAFANTRSVSGNLRTTVWKNSIRMAMSNPLVGVGPGAFGSAYYAFQSEPWLYATFAHNHFLQIFAEIGIPGFILFISLFFIASSLIFKNRQFLQDQKNYPYLLLVATIIIGTTIHALVDFDWSTISLYSMFWIFLSLLISQFKLSEIKILTDGRGKTIMLLPLIVIISSLVLLLAEQNFVKAQNSIQDYNYKKTESYASSAVNLNPYDAKYHYILGQAYYSQAKYDLALTHYKKTIQYDRFGSESYYSTGVIEFQKKHYKEAQKWFEKAITLNPYSNPKLYNALADVYLLEKKPDLAKKELEIAIYKAFPLNESFKGFRYIYDYTGFTQELALTYFKLILLEGKDPSKKDEVKKLMAGLTNLDNKKLLTPFLK